MHLKVSGPIEKMKMKALYHIQGNIIPHQHFLLLYALLQHPSVDYGEIEDRFTIGPRNMDKMILAFVLTLDTRILHEPFIPNQIDWKKVIKVHDPIS